MVVCGILFSGMHPLVSVKKTKKQNKNKKPHVLKRYCNARKLYMDNHYFRFSKLSSIVNASTAETCWIVDNVIAHWLETWNLSTVPPNDNL